MLEINPAYINGTPDDKLNMIDARWIDIETGVFIDITVVRHREGLEPGMMDCKDRHKYMVSPPCFLPLWVFPAVRSV